MRQILHILTRPEDLPALEVIRSQRGQPDITVKTIDLTVPEPDYKTLLREIFAADSVALW
jgi:hypothetical protein